GNPDVHQENSRTARDPGCRSSRSLPPRKSWMRSELANHRHLPTCAFFLGIVCLSSFAAQGQAQNHPHNKQTQTGAQELLRTVKATRIDHAPKLDGTLDDPLWQQATPI